MVELLHLLLSFRGSYVEQDRIRDTGRRGEEGESVELTEAAY